ncbi:hypothetical protein HYS28_00660 [Candidatus Uhrbacteria bacterium]|nr:hypothetical protein [Candidatus Uhrbacteria bacterium]
MKKLSAGLDGGREARHLARREVRVRTLAQPVLKAVVEGDGRTTPSMPADAFISR